MAEERLREEFLVKAALQHVSDIFPNEFKKAIADQKKAGEMKEEARKKVAEHLTTVENVQKKKQKSWDAFSHLSKTRQEKIRSSLKMKTFKMEIDSSGATKTVTMMRGAKEFQTPIKLSSSGDITNALNWQRASVLVECVIFILELIGIDIPDNEEEIKKVIKIAIEALEKSKTLMDDIMNIVLAYENNDKVGVAKGIIVLVIDVFEEGMFWDIVKALLSDMAWYDWILTAAKISAFIVALVATGGLAEIAELISILVDATFFFKKLVNISEFKAM